MNLIIKIINNHNLSSQEIAEEILLVEERMNSSSKLRFHIEEEKKNIPYKDIARRIPDSDLKYFDKLKTYK